MNWISVTDYLLHGFRCCWESSIMSYGMVKPLFIMLGQVLGEAVRASYTIHQMEWARVRLFHGIKVLHCMSNKEKLVWFDSHTTGGTRDSKKNQ